MMKKMIRSWAALILVLVLAMGVTGCATVSQKIKDNIVSQADEQKVQDQQPSKPAAELPTQTIAGLPERFPKEIPLYTGAQVIEADNFNGNHYSVVYNVKADFDDVTGFYMDAFGLDDSGVDDGVAYYEGVEVGYILINGLTIEKAGDMVNVFLTVRDDSQDTLVDDENFADDYSDGGDNSSDIVTYDTAEEVTLDESYPQDVVPIYPDAKIIGCSMVPNTSSGFVDLLLPANDFGEAVDFYTDELGLTPKNSTTLVQEAAEFKGEIDNYKVVVLVSHLLSSGNDTFIQITINEQ